MIALVEALRVAVAPGFWSNGPVQTALLVAGGAAIVSAVVGVFTIMRAQAFAGHALADVSSAGGALAVLVGLNPLLGFIGMAALAAGGMEFAGVRRARERDLATGVILGVGLALAALFLYWDSVFTSAGGAAVMVMFGSMFAIPRATGVLAAAVGVAALAAVALLYRPLLLSAVSGELAAVQGVRVRLTGLLYMLVLALAVALSALTVGAILSTALLIGPAATAVAITRRPGQAMVLAALLGVAATWLGILLAYDSATWTPQHPWPVSFFIVSLTMGAYLCLGGATRALRAGVAPAEGG